MSVLKYAALIKTSTTVPGDERSRTHPGHGYPEHTVEGIELREFKDLAEMEDWVKRELRSSYSRGFRLISFQELQFEETVTVKVRP